MAAPSNPKPDTKPEPTKADDDGYSRVPVENPYKPGKRLKPADLDQGDDD